MSDADPAAAELVVGAWRGYRVWRMSGDRLTGWWYTGYVWAPGASEASCDARRWTLRGRRARHPGLAAPQRDCACGLYALLEPWDFAGYLPSRHFGVSSEANAVIGVAAGWGRAFRGKHGWRAQFAKPVALYRAPHLEQWTGSPSGMAARSSRGEATCSPSLSSMPESAGFFSFRVPTPIFKLCFRSSPSFVGVSGLGASSAAARR